MGKPLGKGLVGRLPKRMECNVSVASQGDDFRGWKVFGTGLNFGQVTKISALFCERKRTPYFDKHTVNFDLP